MGGRIHTERGEPVADLPWKKLPADIPPGEEFMKDYYFRLPGTPGRYEVVIDMVVKGICWFAGAGSTPLAFTIEVT